MAGRDSVVIKPKGEDSPVLSFTAGINDLYWLPRSDGIVYAVASVYDAPGIFIRRIGSDEVTTVVGPRIKNSAYPDGADWIRLCGVEKVGSATWIRFARFGDVDKIDFENPPKPVVERVKVPGADGG